MENYSTEFHFTNREDYFSLSGADYDAARQILVDALKEA